MIEKIILDYLSDKIDVPASTEKQKGLSRYILVRKLGSGRNNHLFKSLVAIQSYGTSDYDASELNERVIKEMLNIDRPEITYCELNSDYPYTNTKTSEHRYQAIFDIKHY